MLRKGQLPIVLVLAIAMLIFSAIFIARKNLEFIIYVGVIIFFFALILYTDKKVKYPNSILWGLTIWAILHMAGGGLYINGARLYELMLIPLSKTLPIFRYDQFVHIVGFGVATLLMHHLLKPSLRHPVKAPIGHAIVIVMAGLGVGAVNEILEFIITVIVPKTGVGGFENAMLDLCADLIGALIALFFIRNNK
jgi:uncharacterized membrane protein YjdF